ncbi:mitochondrial import inner membrane translocase subunit TIM23, putative (TIM23) [Plasmodium ovale curtisi]|uniref:Mitochondrial import inner membrane translocase subunit TIM23, putative (TIM23) n=1 Tax=Plasmodium ovale curtisi TaxID=864141 RepID=A0A1A8VWV5_PLAOA|nr:mitochondrial import inner membrane translocase subunit TIM23, putative (TIM23) [Plasmodium ovale curtisi]
MGDYLKTGSVNYDLEILKKKPEKKLSLDKQNLYLQGYGRQWGEKLVYSVGLAYGSGYNTNGNCRFSLYLHRRTRRERRRRKRKE